MAKIISVGIQKGGVGKSTTSSVLAYALSQDHKVLAVDMDGQGNLTQLLTGSDNIFEFQGKTVWNAITEENATDYVMEINPNLHILCGDEDITTLSRHFYIELEGKFHFVLKNALEKVADNYDYIIIDNPPALGELSVISLTASDYVLIIFETSNFCHNSLISYLMTIKTVQKKANENLKIAGILRSMIDKRRSDNKYYSELVEQEFPEYCMKTIIKHKAEIGRLSALGFINNKEVKKVMKEYDSFLKEIMENVK